MRQTQNVASGYQPGSPQQRAISALLAAAIILIVLLLALLATTAAPRFTAEQVPITFNVSGGAKEAANEPQRRQRRAVVRPSPHQLGTPPPKIAIAKPEPKPVAPTESDQGFIHMSSDDLASADIGKMRADKGDAGSGNTYGPGQGPGGIHLYKGDWYRRPTDAELNGYRTAKMPHAGKGVLACQFAEHYHVENCRILDEAPLGSGFGRAALNASWQFLIRPPTINGKVPVGAWAEITIDYTASEKQDK